MHACCAQKTVLKPKNVHILHCQFSGSLLWETFFPSQEFLVRNNLKVVSYLEFHAQKWHYIYITLHIDTLILSAIILKIVPFHDFPPLACHWLLGRLNLLCWKKRGRRQFSNLWREESMYLHGELYSKYSTFFVSNFSVHYTWVATSQDMDR